MQKTRTKLKTKKILIQNSIATPSYLTLENISRAYVSGKKFILKSNSEHASKGLNTKLYENKKEIKRELKTRRVFFAEEYIEGKPGYEEFNISVLGGNVLPIAAIDFVNWTSTKPRIVDYTAKWNSDSVESRSTVRKFDFDCLHHNLLNNLKIIYKKCWKVFGLKGYARIDFRVDKNDKPYVLEVNTNPCISLDAGFIAATQRAGFTREQVLQKIIWDMN